MQWSKLPGQAPRNSIVFGPFSSPGQGGMAADGAMRRTGKSSSFSFALSVAPFFCAGGSFSAAAADAFFSAAFFSAAISAADFCFCSGFSVTAGGGGGGGGGGAAGPGRGAEFEG